MKKLSILSIIIFFSTLQCIQSEENYTSEGAESVQKTAVLPIETEREAKATFAGGCFWCMESPFEKLNGVSHTGYLRSFSNILSRTPRCILDAGRPY